MISSSAFLLLSSKMVRKPWPSENPQQGVLLQQLKLRLWGKVAALKSYECINILVEDPSLSAAISTIAIKALLSLMQFISVVVGIFVLTYGSLRIEIFESSNDSSRTHLFWLQMMKYQFQPVRSAIESSISSWDLIDPVNAQVISTHSKPELAEIQISKKSLSS